MNASPTVPPASEAAVLPQERRVSWAAVLSVCARWLLGGLFIYMGLSKALNPVEFLKLVRQYELVNQPWALNSIASALPWFEVFCGMLMIAGVAVRGTALMLLATPETLVSCNCLSGNLLTLRRSAIRCSLTSRKGLAPILRPIGNTFR